MPRCTAKSKRSQKRCRKDAVTGGTVCHIHGGKTPRGRALPQTTHGRYSKALPERLMARYGASLADANLTDLSDELALTDARLFEVLGRVDSGESGRLWDLLGKAKRDYQKEADDVKKAGLLLDLLSLIEEGLEDRANWGEIGQLMEQRRRLVDTERKRLADASQMVTAGEALALARSVVALVREHVTDKDTLAKIHGGLASILDRPAAQA